MEPASTVNRPTERQIFTAMDTQISDLSHLIQLAIAPVFLLTAIATMINALNSRLARIIDRRRLVQDRLHGSGSDNRADAEDELSDLARRSHLVYLAIFCIVLSALLVCLVVAGAFLAALFGVGLARTVAAFFIAAMIAMIAGLSLFLREVFLAVRTGNYYRR